MTGELLLAGILLVFAGALAPNPPAQLREYVVDVGRSRLWVITHRSGLLSFLGHEHAIVPTDWSADLCLDHPIPVGAAGSIVIQTSSLVIDSDAARDLAGLGDGPSESQMAAIQRKLLDNDHLASQRYPEIRLDVVATNSPDDGEVSARGRLTLRGITRELQFALRVAVLNDGALQLSGELHVPQSAFDIEPESVARVVNVADEVDLHFRLIANPTTQPCRAP
jgi:polyisoprenoid-binding protein YceI